MTLFLVRSRVGVQDEKRRYTPGAGLCLRRLGRGEPTRTYPTPTTYTHGDWVCNAINKWAVNRKPDLAQSSCLLVVHRVSAVASGWCFQTLLYVSHQLMDSRYTTTIQSL